MDILLNELVLINCTKSAVDEFFLLFLVSGVTSHGLNLPLHKNLSIGKFSV